MKTFVAKPETVKRDWYVVDAEGKTLGRLASEIASRLRGKHKAEYTPHVDAGDYIIVINAEKVRFTGKFQGEIIPTVPRGSYLTKALPPSKLNGKETFLFEIFIHFLRFFFVYSISGMIE